jgi:hypothetical protein
MDLHHQRMISRVRNIMDTLAHRDGTSCTVADEVQFLALEVEAYRAFVHAHEDGIRLLAALDPDEDPRVEADSLYFEVLGLCDHMDSTDGARHVVMPRVGRLSASFLRHAARYNRGLTDRRRAWIDDLRSEVAETVMEQARKWPRETARKPAPA